LASDKELSDFLASVEKRAYKRSLYHVRNEEAALDIVQDSMMKLVEHYAGKPAAELPLLFQRILSNTTLDWFRRQKTRNALFSNYNDFGHDNEQESTDFLEILGTDNHNPVTESAQDLFSRNETVREIESALQNLPGRQREAFLLRYWEELDVAETAAAMGCSEGSVKTHCSRAIQALHKALIAKGYKP
jgi:RNA polymerase sigma-70 factor (ECF subfamily)